MPQCAMSLVQMHSSHFCCTFQPANGWSSPRSLVKIYFFLVFCKDFPLFSHFEWSTLLDCLMFDQKKTWDHVTHLSVLDTSSNLSHFLKHSTFDTWHPFLLNFMNLFSFTPIHFLQFLSSLHWIILFFFVSFSNSGVCFL